MDPVSLGFGVLSAVIQSYSVVTAIYDTYLEYTVLDKDYGEIHMCLMIERCRLDLWASMMELDKMQIDQLQTEHVPSTKDLLLWNLFKMIFDNILSDLQESQEKLEHIGQRTGLPIREDTPDHEFIDRLKLSPSVSASEKPKLKGLVALRKIKFIIRDKQRLKGLIKRLCYLNDSLEKMSSQLEQKSLRQKLKTNFTTQDASEMPQVEAAAAILEHRDIQQLASARLVIEEARNDEIFESDPMNWQLSRQNTNGSETDGRRASFHLDLEKLKFKGSQYATDQPRPLANYNGEEVIVDWRASEDDTWRNNNPKAFRKRTENLTRLLNQDLKPLNLSILHCVGYLNQGKSLTGYAFRLPDHARHSQSHRTLFDLISQERDPRDLPDLGDRFELAKALVNTILEIHSINWMHKNISSKNIIFWPGTENENEACIIRPYLLGFDVSRPNQPFEFSERPAERLDADHYRHPDYREPYDPHSSDTGLRSPVEKELRWRSFKPSYDIYSLGVVLYEIGIWHNVSRNKRSHPTRPSLLTHNSDPNLIQKCLADKQIKDLRRHTGRRYTDVVVACLDRSLDEDWSDPSDDPSTQLRRYLRHVQSRVVDPLAACNA